MGSRVRPDEAFAHGVHRIVRTEIQEALDSLKSKPASSVAIHEARKRIKMARAIGRLLRKDIDVSPMERHLRRAAHSLEGLRDTEAVLGTARSLCRPRERVLPPKTCTALLDMLERAKLRAKDKNRESRVIRRTRRALERARDEAKALHWRRVKFPHFAAGMEKSYRRASQALVRARVRSRTAEFHAWRKRTKTLFYGLKMLEQALPSLKELSSQLKRLDTPLGNAHNLAVLMTHVPTLDAEHRRLVEQQTVRRQTTLQRQALDLGLRAFKERPKDFAADLSARWRRRLKRAPRKSG